MNWAKVKDYLNKLFIGGITVLFVMGALSGETDSIETTKSTAKEPVEVEETVEVEEPVEEPKESILKVEEEPVVKRRKLSKAEEEYRDFMYSNLDLARPTMEHILKKLAIEKWTVNGVTDEVYADIEYRSQLLAYEEFEDIVNEPGFRGSDDELEMIYLLGMWGDFNYRDAVKAYKYVSGN